MNLDKILNKVSIREDYPKIKQERLSENRKAVRLGKEKMDVYFKEDSDSNLDKLISEMKITLMEFSYSLFKK